MPNWSSETYTVIGIDNNNLLLNHPTKRKLYMRHEIIKQYEFPFKELDV